MLNGTLISKVFLLRGVGKNCFLQKENLPHIYKKTTIKKWKKPFSKRVAHKNGYTINKQNIIDAIRKPKLIAVLISKYFFFSFGW